MAKITIKKAWLDGPKGFFQWCADIQPRILTGGNKYEPFVPEPWQNEAILGILSTTVSGDFQNNMALMVTPRRHGKTNLFALIVLWLVTTRPNHTVQVLGNSEDHAERVQLKTLKGIIANTPALSSLIPERDIQRLTIKVTALGGIIQAAANNLASSFGDKLNVLWVGDFHACTDRGPFDAFQASLLDSSNTLCLIDSNPDSEGGHVHQLELEAGTDPKTYCKRIEYRDFEDYRKRAPAWIDRDKAAKLQRTQLEAAFKRDILGQRTAPVNSLFKPEDIEVCRTSYTAPVDPLALPEMFNGRKYVIGCGLDKARAIKLTSSDRTVWTVVAKVARDDGEPEYWVLNQTAIPFSTNSRIKGVIQEDAKRYKPIGIALEAYETEELLLWGLDQRLPVETANPSAQRQYPAFLALHEIVSEGRLFFSQDMKDLEAEMRAFQYDDSGKVITFGHAPGFHDDHVYSLAWAIWATRQQELAIYELPGIHCTSRSPHASMCYLRQGEMILPCASHCLANLQVVQMHNQYRASRPESDMILPDFFKAKVKLNGFKTYSHI